jgi:hypothetical protein
MTQATQRAFLSADKATLVELRSALPEAGVIDRAALVARPREVRAELTSLDAHVARSSPEG